MMRSDLALSLFVLTEAEAITRLSRSPHWVRVAMDPVSKLILAVDVGERTLAIRFGYTTTHMPYRRKRRRSALRSPPRKGHL